MLAASGLVDNQASSQHHDWNIFYHKHRILRDEKTGDFDRDKAEELLVKEAEISEKTGNPRIVDVCCGWPQAFGKLIDFVAKKQMAHFQ
jgi:tetrahydromethanopterin S-methyltransferase subunit H